MGQSQAGIYIQCFLLMVPLMNIHLKILELVLPS